jgi:hypothetical protein
MLQYECLTRKSSWSVIVWRIRCSRNVPLYRCGTSVENLIAAGLR